MGSPDNARGQRLFCEHAENSGTPSHTTTYEYDPKTFRVTRIRTLTSTSTVLQDLQYTHDPVGNITQLTDASTWDTTLASQNPTRKYVYDALYRLTSATGREHAGQQPTDEEPPYRAVPHGNDLYDNLRSYREELTYDRVGNILQMRHLTGPSNSESWSRNYEYELDNNRLKATSVPGDPSGTYSATYEYETGNDAGLHGSMTVMPHLAVLDWDYADRLQHTEKSGRITQKLIRALVATVRHVSSSNLVPRSFRLLGLHALLWGSAARSRRINRTMLHCRSHRGRTPAASRGAAGARSAPSFTLLGGSRDATRRAPGTPRRCPSPGRARRAAAPLSALELGQSPARDAHGCSTRRSDAQRTASAAHRRRRSGSAPLRAAPG